MSVSPPRPKGPPLNSLRAFEAAARLGSFTAAADELGVTAGAISQHIRTLEGWVALPLFERRAQGVRLTAEGRSLLPDFTNAFDALGSASRKLQNLSPDRVLTIAALPSVAQLWLQPRLKMFRAALPDVNLSVTVAEIPPNLSRELFDLTLFMRDPVDCPNGMIIAHDTLTPLCAPNVAARLSRHADLDNETLLHDVVWSADWRNWANASNVTLSSLDDGPQFSLYSMAVEEAKAGAGVLLGHTALLNAPIDDGSLVQPFPTTTTSPLSLIAEVASGAFAEPLQTLLQSFTD